MSVTFSGDKFESTTRLVTQCYSLDRALADFKGNRGFPLKSVVEIYGNKGVGKSSFCFSLMGMMGKFLQKNMVILDWEGQSRDTIEGVLNAQGYFGNVEYISNRPDESSEDTVERFLLAVKDDDQNIGLVDSIGGFLPTAYLEGQVSDSSMGVFARETGRMVNKAKQLVISSENPAAIFMTNHVHPKIGGFVQGNDTAGGVKKKYLSHVRMDVSRYFGNKKSPVSGFVSFDGGWLMKGKVDDNRYGFSKGEFTVWMMGGEGIHVGMTALFDCVLGGLAKVSAKAVKESATVSLDGKSYGKLGYILEHRNDDPDFFTPFHNALRENDVEYEESEEEEE